MRHEHVKTCQVTWSDQTVARLQSLRVTHRVCGSGIGKEIQRKGSNVLLCFWQCGQVREDLLGRNHKS